jgi:hypothetical protein
MELKPYQATGSDGQFHVAFAYVLFLLPLLFPTEQFPEARRYPYAGSRCNNYL